MEPHLNLDNQDNPLDIATSYIKLLQPTQRTGGIISGIVDEFQNYINVYVDDFQSTNTLDKLRNITTKAYLDRERLRATFSYVTYIRSSKFFESASLPELEVEIGRYVQIAYDYVESLTELYTNLESVFSPTTNWSDEFIIYLKTTEMNIKNQVEILQDNINILSCLFNIEVES